LLTKFSTSMPWLAVYAAILLALLGLATTVGAQEDEAPATTLSAEIDENSDDQIAAGLRERFRQLEELEGVEIEVEAGVVRLMGKVLTEAAREKAERLARRIDGVAEVDNRLEVELDVAPRVTPVLEKVVALGRDTLAYLPLLAVSLLVVIAFNWLGRLLTRWRAPFERLAPNPFLQDLARQAVRVGAFLVGLLIALDILDAMALVGAVLGTAGVVGLALGFAFRDLVENYIASLLLSVRQPFAPDDFVEIDGREGTVIRLTSRATILMTLDGNHLRIPNAQVFKGVIMNYSRNPLRRFDFGVGVGVGEDLAAAQQIGKDVLSGMKGVLEDPAPWSQITELGDSSVSIKFYAWIDQREHSFPKVRSEAIRQVKGTLESAGMDLPEPIYRVQLSRASTGSQPASKLADTMASPAAVETGVETGDAIEKEIATERATTGERDLLSAEAPRE